MSGDGIADIGFLTESSCRRFLFRMTGLFGAVGLALAAWPLIDSLNPSADRLTPVWVDLSDIPVGGRKTVQWGDWPIFIAHRTPEEIAEARALDETYARRTRYSLESKDEARVQRPQWLVIIGFNFAIDCRITGQAPAEYRGKHGGWYDPCSGISYDTSGRAAFPNDGYWDLMVPQYQFVGESELKFPFQR